MLQFTYLADNYHCSCSSPESLNSANALCIVLAISDYDLTIVDWESIVDMHSEVSD